MLANFSELTLYADKVIDSDVMGNTTVRALRKRDDMGLRICVNNDKDGWDMWAQDQFGNSYIFVSALTMEVMEEWMLEKTERKHLAIVPCLLPSEPRTISFFLQNDRIRETLERFKAMDNYLEAADHEWLMKVFMGQEKEKEESLMFIFPNLVDLDHMTATEYTQMVVENLEKAGMVETAFSIKNKWWAAKQKNRTEEHRLLRLLFEAERKEIQERLHDTLELWPSQVVGCNEESVKRAWWDCLLMCERTPATSRITEAYLDAVCNEKSWSATFGSSDVYPLLCSQKSYESTIGKHSFLRCVESLPASEVKSIWISSTTGVQAEECTLL